MSALPQPTVSLPSPNLTSTATTKILLKTLSSSSSLTHLKQIHAQILRSNHSHSQSLILKLLLSSSSLPYSVSIFNQFPNPLPSLSTPFLRHLSRSFRPEFAFLVYQRLRNEGLRIDRFSFPPLLKAAARVEGLAEGKELHGFGFKLGVESDPFVQTGLMGMYLACGRVLEARQVFDKMSYRDIVAWSIMIDGYGFC
ncbi:hypothetical protein CCACVL1_12773 [Corchorus capsularis]|uniref:Pentatricopeptide repeat-containing protein n=1 Tax=Corchorus capsularis TaxID=210143 RepID=A0A1R3IDX8_COCAP|nr:hypothetical protein CCACVL1_12773 [Corchorus capsularis]